MAIFRKKPIKDIPKEDQCTFKEVMELCGWDNRGSVYYWIDKGVLKRYKNKLGQVRFDINDVSEVNRLTKY